jgi:hypothetical protein
MLQPRKLAGHWRFLGDARRRTQSCPSHGTNSYNTSQETLLSSRARPPKQHGYSCPSSFDRTRIYQGESSSVRSSKSCICLILDFVADVDEAFIPAYNDRRIHREINSIRFISICFFKTILNSSAQDSRTGTIQLHPLLLPLLFQNPFVRSQVRSLTSNSAYTVISVSSRIHCGLSSVCIHPGMLDSRRFVGNSAHGPAQFPRNEQHALPYTNGSTLPDVHPAQGLIGHNQSLERFAVRVVCIIMH